VMRIGGSSSDTQALRSTDRYARVIIIGRPSTDGQTPTHNNITSVRGA
jgi:hypothetical protein